MIAGTYEIRNKLDGMAYGGSSGNIEGRWRGHLRMLRNDRHHCAYFQNAWNKYGGDVFEFIVLEIIEDPDERLAAEQVWLDKHHAEGTCYNTALDAIAPMLGRTQTEGFRLAQSERMMGNQHGLGYKHTEEQNRAKSERQMGRKHTKVSLQKMRGRVVSEEARRWLSKINTGELNARWGTRHTEETLCKMRGRVVSDEIKRKQSERMMGNQWWLGRKHTDATKLKQSKARKLWWAKKKAADSASGSEEL